MVKTVLSVVAGFVAWFVVLIAGEQLVSLLLPQQFGKPQAAFQKAIEDGGVYDYQSLHLLLHIGLALVACLLAGFVVAALTGKHKYAALSLGLLLLCVGLLKAGLTWQLVPLWYHIAFTGILLPATLAGAALKSSPGQRQSGQPVGQ